MLANTSVTVKPLILACPLFGDFAILWCFFATLESPQYHSLCTYRTQGLPIDLPLLSAKEKGHQYKGFYSTCINQQCNFITI